MRPALQVLTSVPNTATMARAPGAESPLYPTNTNTSSMNLKRARNQDRTPSTPSAAIGTGRPGWAAIRPGPGRGRGSELEIQACESDGCGVEHRLQAAQLRPAAAAAAASKLTGPRRERALRVGGPHRSMLLHCHQPAGAHSNTGSAQTETGTLGLFLGF
jgi:hypothetical protein